MPLCPLPGVCHKQLNLPSQLDRFYQSSSPSSKDAFSFFFLLVKLVVIRSANLNRTKSCQQDPVALRQCPQPSSNCLIFKVNVIVLAVLELALWTRVALNLQCSSLSLPISWDYRTCSIGPAKNTLFKKWCWASQVSMCKRVKLTLFSTVLLPPHPGGYSVCVWRCHSETHCFVL